jgi:hypothetical protein
MREKRGVLIKRKKNGGCYKEKKNGGFYKENKSQNITLIRRIFLGLFSFSAMVRDPRIKYRFL